MRTRALARRLSALGHFDAVIQIGTGYAVPPGPRVATFEDLTIPQAVSLDYPGWDQLSAAAIRSRKDLQRRSYERATACCSSTLWASESVISDYGIDRAKVHAVGIGRNSEPTPPAERDWSTPRFLFVGLDWEGKNGPGVLRAFARVRALIPEARLDVVGAHPPIDAPGVHGHGVMVMGVAEDKARLERLFEAATCFVLPSHRDAAGIVYLEAAAAGLPVIGSAAGGPRDLIGDGGCVVDPADDEALFEAMRAYSDPALAQKLGAAGLRRAPRFTWRAVAGRMAHALAPLASGNRSGTRSRPRMVANRALPPVTIAYHGVSRVDPADDALGLVMAPELLESQVRLLLRAGYRFRTAGELAQLGRRPARGTATLTFDDGWQDAVEIVAPLLDSLGVSATFFVNPGLWGSKHPDVRGPGGALMDAEGARSLVAAGFELGSHSMTHVDLRTLDDAALARELTESRAAVEALTGSVCRTLAYPYGAHDARVQAAARNAGYQLALAWLPGPWNPFAAPRLPGPTRHGASRLMLKMSGIRRRKTLGPPPTAPAAPKP